MTFNPQDFIKDPSVAAKLAEDPRAALEELMKHMGTVSKAFEGAKGVLKGTGLEEFVEKVGAEMARAEKDLPGLLDEVLQTHQDAEREKESAIADAEAAVKQWERQRVELEAKLDAAIQPPPAAPETEQPNIGDRLREDVLQRFADPSKRPTRPTGATGDVLLQNWVWPERKSDSKLPVADTPLTSASITASVSEAPADPARSWVIDSTTETADVELYSPPSSPAEATQADSPVSGQGFGSISSLASANDPAASVTWVSVSDHPPPAAEPPAQKQEASFDEWLNQLKSNEGEKDGA